MSNATAQITGTIVQIDPTELMIDDNVRTDATVAKGFVDSIRENGVLVPVLGWRDPDGVVHVRAGQRRTLAAREAGVGTIPVYVVDATHGDAARRIIAQIVENDQREDISDADRIEAWKQLELEGLSATAIARRTGAKREHIKTGLAVAASETGIALLGQGGLTLDQAATLLEFEDHPDILAQLTEYATSDPDYFPVAVQRARNEQIAAKAKRDAEDAEAAKGHRILTDRPGWNETPYRLRMLTTATGEAVTAADVEGKEGVSVFVAVYNGGDAQAEYFVDDPEALGFTIREDVELSTPQTGPMTDEQKAERKALIANNKEWDAAETVRREWIATFLSRKTLPKDATTVLATLLTCGHSKIGDAMIHGNATAKSLLAIEQDSGTCLADLVVEHPVRALHVALAIALGGVEESTSRESWRHPQTPTARYLQALNAWGYPLCPVERIAAMLSVEEDAEPAE